MNTAAFLADFYDRCRAAFDDASSRLGMESAAFTIARQTFRVLSAGPAIHPLVTTAFRHLPAASVPGETFTIRCFDSRTSGISADTAALVRLNEIGVSGENLAPGAPILGGFRRPDYGVALYHRERNEALYWIADAVDEPYSRTTDFTGMGHPLKGLLGWWFGDNGLAMLHAAVVGIEDRSILMAGRGGSGKSTTAFACMDAGWQIVAEDTCLYDPVTRVAHSLYCTGRLTDASRVLLGTWAAPEDGWETGKAIFLLDSPPGRANLVPSLPVNAIVIPRQWPGEPSSLRPLSGGAALRALLPSTMFQSITAQTGQASEMAALCRAVPSYELVIGTAPATLPPLLRAALKDTGE